MSAEDFHRRVHNKEIWLRGFYLSMSCDMEYVLMDLICTCLARTAKEREDFRITFFENVSFARKISLAKNVLETHFPEDYNLNKDIFPKFKELKDKRNTYAHSKISGDDSSQDDNILWFETIKEGKLLKDRVMFSDLEADLRSYKPYIDRLLLLIIILYNKKRLV